MNNLMRQHALKLFESPSHHHQTSRPKFPNSLKPQPHRKRLNPPIILFTKQIQSPQQLTHPKPLLFPLFASKKLRRRRPEITRPFMERGRPARPDARRLPCHIITTMRQRPTPSHRKIPRHPPKPRSRLPQLPHQKLPQPPNLKPIDELPRRNPQLKTNPLDRPPRSHDAPPLKRILAPALRQICNFQFAILNFQSFRRNLPINPSHKFSYTPLPNLRIPRLRIPSHKIRNPPPRFIRFLRGSAPLPVKRGGAGGGVSWPLGPRRFQIFPNSIQPHMLMRNIKSHNALPFENEASHEKILRVFEPSSLCVKPQKPSALSLHIYNG